MPQRVKKQLEWSARSESDLLAIDAYIFPDNPIAAEQVVDYIISQAELLTRFAGASRGMSLIVSRA